MSINSSYSLLYLKVIVLISCGLSILLLLFLAKKFLGWISSNRDLVVLIYGIAILVLTVNIFFMFVYVTDNLNSREEIIRYTDSPVLRVTSADNSFNKIYIFSSIVSFILIWGATVFLLRYYSKRLGSVRYWIIMSAPLIYFLSQFQSIFINLFDSFRLQDPILFGIIFTIVFTMSKPIGGILFGVTFWIVSRRIGNFAIRDYLVVSGFGLTLLFAANQATSLIYAPYPPFGLVTTSLLGVSSYLFLVGIYSSAMSISRDTELRKFVQSVVDREIKLLGPIAFAEIERELITKVIPVVNRKAHNIQQETGVATSITDAEIKTYLEEVLTEFRNVR